MTQTIEEDLSVEEAVQLEAQVIEQTEEQTSAQDSSRNFVLKWIEFTNFRRFGDTTKIEPDTHGFTGITGSTGAGKSSFMMGLLYALFAKVPKGVKVSGLRHRDLDPKTNPTTISIGFEHQGQTIEVIRKLTGGSSTASGDVYLDGEHVVKSSGGEVTKWVVNRLGMDVEGFKTAVVVPQEELKNLVSAVPSERRALIEKLAGIEEMNAAVKNARKQQNDLNAVVKELPGDPELVDGLTEEIEELERQVAVSGEGRDELAGEVSGLRQRRTEANQSVQEIRDALEVQRSAQRRVDDLTGQRQMKALSRDGQKQRIQDLRNQYPDATVTDLDALNQERTELRGHYTELGNSIKEFYQRRQGLQSSRDSVLRAVSGQEQELQGLQSQESEVSTWLSSVNPDQLRADLQASRDRLVEHQGAGSTAQSKLRDTQESLETLRKHDTEGGHSCPTCHQDLADPAALISSFEELMEMQQGRIQAAQQGARQEQTLIRELEAKLGEIEGAQWNREQIAQRITRLESDLSAQKEQLESYESQLSQLDPSQVEEWERQQQEISARGASVGQQIKENELIVNALAEINQLTAVVENEEKSLRDLEEVLSEAQDTLRSSGDASVIQERLQSSIDELRPMEDRLDAAVAKLNELEVAHTGAETSLRYTREKLAAEKARIVQKEQKLAELSTLSATTSLLDEFRQNRIARIAPELSAYSSELIAAATEGVFTEINVAEDFSTTVTNSSGQVFTVDEVSGGERSAVAICLRIAISSLISNENPGLMWFDEALSDQDAVRRSAMVNMLRSLSTQQVIMINHTNDAEDIVDRTIRVIRSDNFSTVEQ